MFVGEGEAPKKPPTLCKDRSKASPPLGKKSSKEEPTWGKRSYSSPMGVRRGGRVGGRPPPPPPTGKLIFFCYLGGFFVTFSPCGGHFWLYGGPFLDLAPLRKLLRAPMAPPHRLSSEKMCYLIFPGKGRSAYTFAPPPPLSGHPSPPYKNRSASFFASYDLNLKS